MDNENTKRRSGYTRQRDERPKAPSAFQTVTLTLPVDIAAKIAYEAEARGVSRSLVVAERLAASYASEAEHG